jgi:hypothetical protein
MKARPTSDHAIAQWLRDEAQAGAPDRLLATTRRELMSVKQRRSWWPAWRFESMTTPARFLSAAAAVAVVAVIAVLALPRAGGGPGALPSPSATVSQPPPASTTPAPSSSPPPLTLRGGPLVPGRYIGYPVGAVNWLVTVPSGFEGFGHDGLIPTRTGTGAPNGMGFAVLWVGNLYSDPCHGTSGDIATGSSVDEFINAIAAQPMYASSAPTAVTIGGSSGKQIDIQLPSDVDLATCTNKGGDPSVPTGSGGYFVWQSREASGANVFAQGPGDRFHVRVLDVAGTRVVVLTQDFAGTSTADLATMQAIVDSVEFNP